MQSPELDKLSQHFSHQECIFLLDIMSNLSDVTVEHELVYIISTEIRKLVPFEIAVCGIGNIKTKQFTYMLNIDYPSKFLDDITQNNTKTKIITSPVIDQIIASDIGLIKVNDALSFNEKYEQWTGSAKEHHIKDMIAVKKLHLSSATISYFCFTNLLEDYQPYHDQVLKLLTPFLDVALFEVSKCTQLPGHNKLSNRETEILEFLIIGFSNKEIANRLNLSEQTVKHHVSSILLKTQTKTRLQAALVAKAAGMI